MASLCKLEKDAPSSRCLTSLILLGHDALLPSARNVHNKLQFFEVYDVNATTLNVCPCAVYNLYNHRCDPGCHSDLFKIQM